MSPIAEIPENVVIYDREVITSGGRRLGVCNDGDKVFGYEYVIQNLADMVQVLVADLEKHALAIDRAHMKPTSSPANGTRVQERRVVFKV